MLEVLVQAGLAANWPQGEVGICARAGASKFYKAAQVDRAH